MCHCLPEKTLALGGATLDVKDLAPGTYRVQWWDTRLGKAVKEERVSPSGGVLRLAVPTFARDIACKIVPGPTNL